MRIQSRIVKPRIGTDVDNYSDKDFRPRVGDPGELHELADSIGRAPGTQIDAPPRCVSLSARTMDTLQKLARVAGISADVLVDSWVSDTLVDPVLDDIDKRAAAGLARRLCWLAGLGKPGRPGRLATALKAALTKVERVVAEVRGATDEEAARRGATADKVRAFCQRHFKHSNLFTPASVVRDFLRFSDGRDRITWEVFAAAYPRIFAESRWRSIQVDQALCKAVTGMKRERRLAAERAEEARQAAL
jgi:hypothetical protein